jgi:hypothetical protein
VNGGIGIVIVRACIALVERHVDLEILHRRVEVFLDDAGRRWISSMNSTSPR